MGSESIGRRTFTGLAGAAAGTALLLDACAPPASRRGFVQHLDLDLSVMRPLA